MSYTSDSVVKYIRHLVGIINQGIILFIVCLLFMGGVVSGAAAEGESTDKTSYWGTVGRGMGGAYTAAAGDIGGISYNPANSATIIEGQFTSDYNRLTQLSVDVNNSALAGAYRTGDFVHGLGLYRTDLEFDFGNFDQTTGFELNYTDDVFYYNLAYNLSDNIHLGSNLKYYSVTTDVSEGNASGYGVDLGYIQFLGEQLTLGGSLKNLISTKDWDTGESENIPLEARVGLRFRPVADVALEGDLVYGEDPGLRSINVGGEWWLWRRFEEPEPLLRRAYFRRLQRQSSDRVQFGVALRGGMEIETAGSKNNNFSAGLGMQFGEGYLNYSYQQRSDFDNQHFFGLAVTFGEPNNDQEETTFTGNEEGTAQESAVSGQQAAETSEFEEIGWDVTLKPGLLQWKTEDIEKKFDIRRLEEALGELADYEATVYSENKPLQNALLNDQLTSGQIEQLLEKTGRESLVNGKIERTEDGQYRAQAIITTAEDRREIEITVDDFDQLYSELASRIDSYLK